jgi:type I protein arginine methyltransferase
VYGFTMAPIAGELRSAAAGKVAVRPVDAAALVTAPALLHSLDLAAMRPGQQDFTAEAALAALPEAASGGGGVAGGAGGAGGAAVGCVVLWFDVEFSARFCPERPVTLSTAPSAPQTHWAQAVLPLRAAVELPPGGALAVRLSMARSVERHRTLDVSLEYGPMAAGAAAAEGGGGGGAVRGALREAASFRLEIGGDE